jgi:hypothetical protein
LDNYGQAQKLAWCNAQAPSEEEAKSTQEKDAQQVALKTTPDRVVFVRFVVWFLVSGWISIAAD